MRTRCCVGGHPNYIPQLYHHFFAIFTGLKGNGCRNQCLYFTQYSIRYCSFAGLRCPTSLIRLDGSKRREGVVDDPLASQQCLSGFDTAERPWYTYLRQHPCCCLCIPYPDNHLVAKDIPMSLHYFPRQTGCINRKSVLFT
jgi:hypothetical protein